MLVLALVLALLCHAPVLAQPRAAAGDDLTTLRGRVLAGDGSATPLRSTRMTVVPAGPIPTTVVTDGEGWFEALVPARGGWSMRVTKAGYVSADLAFTTVPGDDIVVRLTRGAVITGRVVDHLGDAVSGMTIRVSPEPCPDPCQSPAAAQPGTRGYAAETDDLGAFRVGGLPAGRYEVWFGPAATTPSSAASLTQDTLLMAAAGRPGASERTAARQSPPAAIVSVRPGDETTVHLVREDASLTRGAAVSSGEPATRRAALPTPIVRGRITGPTGRPIDSATARLDSVYGTYVMVGRSDVEGRYEIAGVPPGTYRLTVTTAGFAPFEYGQERVMEQGTPITLRAGEVLERIDVRLPPGGVIAGRVVDADGEPIEGLAVQAWQLRTTGARTGLTPVGGVSARRTDDLGQYRLYGLPPGTYYVAAFDPETSNDAVRMATAFVPGDLTSLAAARPMRVSAGTFHPGSERPADAVPVWVEPGRDALGVDIVVVPAPLARVRGVAVDASGHPAPGSATLRMSHRSGAPALRDVSANLGSDGTFEFLDVPPGEYVIQVRARSGTDAAAILQWSMSGRLPPGIPEFGLQFVTVSDADVVLSFRTAPGARVGGRLVVDGDRSLVEPASFEVGVAPADPDRTLAAALRFRRLATGDPWALEIDGLFGPVRFELHRAPPGWYLKSALVDGVDAAEYPVTFEATGTRDRDVEIVVAQGGEISGSAAGARGEPLADYAVVVFSTDASRWYERSRYLQLVRPGLDGAFIVSGLPPGEYWVAAVDRIRGGADSGEWQSPGMLSSLIAGARRVRVDERQEVPVSLRLMRMPGI